jgi:hypothetical protein
MIGILNKYGQKLPLKFLLIITISVCSVSCKNSATLNEVPETNEEYAELVKFCNDTTVDILESKKSGDWMFSKYRKDILVGLISTYNDSVAFINDSFFATSKTEYQQFDFIDSLKIEFNIGNVFNNGTINYKYIFGFSSLSRKWLLEYAEKKEFTTEQSVYLFTDKFQQKISLENFSAYSFNFANDGSFHQYKYKKNKYLDSIEIQVKSMKAANVTSFKNIFTIDHAEDILRDYTVYKTNVTSLNNIAYYLEQMSITLPAITILETIVDNYPDRIISYLNLCDALTKNNLRIKAKKVYKQYVNLMKAKGKQKEILQRVF